jgi:hypothetical protein
MSNVAAACSWRARRAQVRVRDAVGLAMPPWARLGSQSRRRGRFSAAVAPAPEPQQRRAWQRAAAYGFGAEPSETSEQARRNRHALSPCPRRLSSAAPGDRDR